MLTAEEFAAECRPLCVSEAEYTPTETTAEVYEILSALVREEKLTPADVFSYAAYKWCMKNSEAIIAYQIGPYRETPIHRKWAVNNCSEEITEEAARVKVCEEFGFEASRIKIIGTPYYDATDWTSFAVKPDIHMREEKHIMLRRIHLSELLQEASAKSYLARLARTRSLLVPYQLTPCF